MKTRSQTKTNIEHANIRALQELSSKKTKNGTVRNAATANTVAKSAGTPRVQSDSDASLRDLPDLDVIGRGDAALNGCLIDFVQNLRKAEIIDDVLTLPRDACIGGRSELAFLRGRLLVRQCYRELKNAIVKMNVVPSMNRFLITGNPGIGKSLFTCYMLHELMKENERAEKKKKRCIVWKPFGMDECVCITSTTIYYADDIRAFAKELDKRSSWYIVDGEPPDHVEAATLLVTSPARHVSKKFAKRMVTTRFMPVWSKEEIDMVKARRMAFDSSNGEELEQSVIDRLYEHWGGIPRYVFQWALNPFEQGKLQLAVDSLDIDELRKFHGEMDGDEASHNVMHMKVTIDVAEEDRYQKYVMDFASPYVRRRLRKRVIAQHHDDVKELIRAAACTGRPFPMADAFRRMLIETYMHNLLLSGQKLRVRKLDEKASAGNEPFYLQFDDLERKKLTNAEDDVDAEDKPTRKTFNSVDSLLYRNKLFRMTVSYEQDVDTAGMKEVVDHMLSEQTGQKKLNFELYFVVPSYDFLYFQRQQYTSEESAVKVGIRVDQYALEADLPSTCFSGMESRR